MKWRDVYSTVMIVALSTESIRHIYANVDTRGMSPELQRKLSGIPTFACDTGKKQFSSSRINDNYCDCEDGSDEPGTSACSHTFATYYCHNQGYIPSHLPTSRVNDGLCDCCDGSDEYASTVECHNTCASLMEALLKDRQQHLDAYEQGRKERATLVEAAASKLRQDQARLVELRHEIDVHKQTVAEKEDVKEKEEAKEEQEKQEQIKASKTQVLHSLGLLDLNVEQLSGMVLELVTTEATKEGLLTLLREVREAAGMPLAPISIEEDAWKIREATREKEAQEIERLNVERKREREEQEIAAATRRKEALDRGEQVDDEDESTKNGKDEVDRPLPEVEEHPAILLLKMLKVSPTARPEANVARNELATARSALSNTENDMEKLEKRINQAEQGFYGSENVLYTLQDTCVSTRSGEYTYSMCWFGKATQDQTSLGTMDTFNSTELLFTGGTKCWNGPQRSLAVRLDCGAITVLTNVEEPSTCVYTAKLTTPVACVEEYKTQLLSPDHNDGVWNQPHHIEFSVNPTL